MTEPEDQICGNCGWFQSRQTECGKQGVKVRWSDRCMFTTRQWKPLFVLKRSEVHEQSRKPKGTKKVGV